MENNIETCLKHETYLSVTIKNDLLKCCYQVLTEGLLKEVKASKIFALIFDEASNMSNKEELSFYFRSFNSNNDIREEFPKFIQCDEGVAGRDLFGTMTNTLSEFGLDLMNFRVCVA